MKIKMTALFAALALAFYGLKLTEELPSLSTYQMAIGTLLALSSYHLSLKVFVTNQSYHVLIILFTAGLLTLDKAYSHPGMPTVYLMLVTMLHALALLMVLISMPFVAAPEVAHAQHSVEGRGDDDE